MLRLGSAPLVLAILFCLVLPLLLLLPATDSEVHVVQTFPT